MGSSRRLSLMVDAHHKPSQHSYRIKSRREMMSSVGLESSLEKMKNKIKAMGLAYATSRSCMLFLAIMTLASCLFYIVATYFEHELWVFYLETAFGIIFLVDFILSVAAAPIPLSYVLSSGGLIDLVSCLPAFGAFQPWMSSLAFIRYLRVSKAIRVMRNHKLLASIFSDDDFTIKTTLLIVKVLGVVLMTSAILYGVERGFTNDDDGTGAFNEPGWQWHDALYFTIVTLSTVGYGDILPVSALSRLLMVVVIVFALTYVPLEVGKLVDAVNARPKNRRGISRSLLGKQIHVILAMSGGKSGDGGKGAEFDYDTLERCVGEFFEKDQTGRHHELLWVVVMSPVPPTPEITALCNSPKYHSRVLYYRGSITNPRDMEAVCAEYADCIFLFPSKSVDGDTRAAEERTHLAAKSVRRYLDRTSIDEKLMSKVKHHSQTGTTCRTVVTVEKLHSKEQLLGFGIDHVICHDELKMAMFAAATLSPAFLPFVANSIRSCDGQGNTSGSKGDPNFDSDDEVNYGIYSSREGAIGIDKSTSGDDWVEVDNWLVDYTKGAGYEIYSIPLEVLSKHSSLWTMSFASAAGAMYDESEGKVILIGAVDRSDKGGSNVVPLASRRRRTTSSGKLGGGRGAVALAAKIAPGYSKAGASVGVFPDKSFRFTMDTNLIVLSETQTMAEDLILDFQGPGEDDHFLPTSSSIPQTSTAVESLTSNTMRASGAVFGSAVDTSAASASTDLFAPAFAPAAVDSAGGDADNSASATAPFAERRVAASSEAVETDERGSLSALVLPEVLISNDASLVNSPAESTASRARMMSMSPTVDPAVLAMQLDRDSKGVLGKLRKDAFAETEIDWTEAREALKRARRQLDELDEEANAGAQDPANFFEKVGAVSESIADALRLHTTSLPPNLRGHIVLVGGKSRLKHYIQSLRRQRPMKPLVVVTEDKASFFELRDRLVESKFFDMGLNISNIYHVFGRCQDRFTLEEANVAQAESVVLMADHNHETSVLLTSFELEQVMDEMPPEERRPKVLIDLSKDSSIYYCGAVLGGEGPSPTWQSARFEDTQPVRVCKHEDVRYWPLFASGRVWTTSIMDVLAVRTYFNPHVLSFFQTLLQIEKQQPTKTEGAASATGKLEQRRQEQAQSALDTEDEMEEEEQQQKIGDAMRDGGVGSVRFRVEDTHSRVGRYWEQGATGNAGDSGCSGGSVFYGDDRDDSPTNPGRCQFGHLRVHASFAGKTYGDLVRYVISRGAIPLGLYRPAGTKGSTLCYTHINPDPQEPLRPWPDSTFKDNIEEKSDVEEEREEKRDAEGRDKAHPGLLWARCFKRGAGRRRRGDDVFVIRSQACALFKEVSLPE